MKHISILPGETNTALLASPRPNTTTASTTKDLDNVIEYDYIIIGTGTAGCVLANRLSEDPSKTVLAIESGHSDLKQVFSRIPAAFARLFGTAADYAIWTTPQRDCNGRELCWPRGKMIGGCSSINAMIYNRGSPQDYDEWERLGNSGWAFKDVEPFMRKSESFNPSIHPDQRLSYDELNQHGQSGPWKIGYSHIAPISKVFIDACAAVGFQKVRDLNSNKGINGVSQVQTFIDPQGQRSSAAVAYLTANVASRSNLKIASGQTVTRIIFEGSKAVGVEMKASNATPIRYLAKARKEIIVSAGAVHTPHILKLSGIGPAEELAQHGISLIKDLPGVGKNLADHIYGTLVFKCTKGSSLQYLANTVTSLPDLVEWFRSGTGAMTSNVADAAAFCRTADREDAPLSLRNNDLSSGPGSADLEILTGAVSYINHGKDVAPTNEDYSSLGPIMLRPESRGTVKLQSTDPFVAPLVDANYLSTKHDRDLMIYGLKLARQIVHSAPFKPHFRGWYWPIKAGEVDDMDDEQLLQHLRDTCETIYHPMGSARMGSDADSVVDSQLKVHGIQGLRIADASIFPTPVACHPCSAVIMVGEKAADIIKNAA